MNTSVTNDTLYSLFNIRQYHGSPKALIPCLTTQGYHPNTSLTNTVTALIWACLHFECFTAESHFVPASDRGSGKG